MIELIWAVLCAHTIIDKESNNISLIHVIEQLTVTRNALPSVSGAFGFDLVTLWSRSDLERPAKGAASISLKLPSGTETEMMNIDVDLTDYKRSRVRVGIQGFPIEESGKYIFQIKQIEGDNKPKLVGEIPLEVIVEEETRGDKPVDA